MKRRYIIGILSVLWIISMIVAGFSIDKYIDDQKEELRLELCHKVKGLFEGQESGGAFVTIKTVSLMKHIAVILLSITKK